MVKGLGWLCRVQGFRLKGLGFSVSVFRVVGSRA